MLESRKHRDVEYLITDEGPFGHPDGKYVVCQGPKGWQVVMLESGCTIHSMSGPTPLTSYEAALDFTIESIDRDLADAQAAERGTLPEFSEHEHASPKPQSVNTGEEGDFPIPLQAIIGLHNAMPAEHPLRLIVQSAIQAHASDKWQAAGVLLSPAGDLTYDPERARQNLYLRKASRYMEAVRKGLRELRTNLEFSTDFHATAKVASSHALAGEPLTALAQETPALRALTASDSPLSRLLEQTSVHEQLMPQFLEFILADKHQR